MQLPLRDKLELFCGFVKSVGNIPCLLGKTAMTPQILGPFAVVWLSEFEPVPRDTSHYEDIEPDEGRIAQVLRGMGIMRLEVQAFGSGVVQTLKHVNAAIETDIWTEVMGPCGMGLSEKSSVQNISASLLSSNYEERAMFTCAFYTSCPERYEVQYFNREEVTVVDEGSGRSYTDTIPDIGDTL